MGRIVLQAKNVYGNILIYPVCSQSKAFAHLVGKKTLSPNDLKDISFLGFRIGFNNIPTSKTEEYNQTGFVGFDKFLDTWNA